MTYCFSRKSLMAMATQKFLRGEIFLSCVFLQPACNSSIQIIMDYKKSWGLRYFGMRFAEDLFCQKLAFYLRCENVFCIFQICFAENL